VKAYNKTVNGTCGWTFLSADSREGKSSDLMGIKDPKAGKEFKWYFEISSQ
jgi:hypothetical protein